MVFSWGGKVLFIHAIFFGCIPSPELVAKFTFIFTRGRPGHSHADHSASKQHIICIFLSLA